MKKINILIIGKNSFLANNYIKYSELKKNITLISRHEIKKINFKNFTHLINFSYDSKLSQQKKYKNNFLDEKICRLINNDKLIYVYPSSRAVLKINKKREIYGKDKFKSEKIIKKYRKKKLPNIKNFKYFGIQFEQFKFIYI